MNRSLLYIDGELVDLLPSTVVACTFKAFEIGDITSRNSSYTNRFKLPKTGRNRRIFGFSDDVNSLTDKPYVRLKGRVVQDGIEVMRDAAVQLRESDDSFNIELFSGTFNFFDLLGDRSVADLLHDSLPQLTDWPLSNSLLHDDIFFNQGNLNEGANPMTFAGKLCIKYSDVIDYIISENGYTKSGDVFTNATYLALYLLAFCFKDQYNEQFRAPREFEAHRDTSANFAASSSDTRINFTEVIKNGGLYDGVNTYEVDDPNFGGTFFYANAYAVIVISNISFAGGATRLRIQLFSGSATYTINDITAAGTYLLELSDNIDQDPLGSPVNKISGIDGLEVYVHARTTDSLGVAAGSATVTFGAGTSFRVECLRENPQPGLFTNVGGVLPDIPQKDFMRDFAIRTGTLFRESGSVLECKTIKEIIEDRANAVNWTSKRDASQPDKVTYAFREYAQNNYFRYNSDDDATTEETGQGNIEIANENLESENEVYVAPFTSSHTRKHGNSAGFITCAEIPIMEDGVDENDPGARLIMVRAKRSYEPTLSGGDSSYRVGYFEDVDGLEGKDASFAHALSQHYVSLSSYLQKAKTITRYYKLTVVDIASLDLFKLVYDDGAYYLINTVENFVPGQSTKVELFKVS